MWKGDGLKSPILFESNTLSNGIFIGSWFEVAIEFVFVGWRIEVADDGVNDRPEITGVFEGGLEDLLGLDGEVVVSFTVQKLLEGVEILSLVVVKNTLGFVVPEIDVMLNDILPKAIEIAVVFDQGFSFVDVLTEELSNASKAG